MNGWLESGLGWLTPSCCRLCGDVAGSGVLCRGCAGALRSYAEPTLVGWNAGNVDDGRAVRVRNQPAWPLDRVVCALTYEGPVRRLVHELKFEGALPIGRFFGEQLADSIRKSGAGQVRLLVPVPLHRSRVWQRGFNQSREIARTLSQELQIPLAWPGFCARVRATQPQSSLAGGRLTRQRNVAAAFKVRGNVAGAAVAVVDDVVTTGATVVEFARTLRVLGAELVEAWIACRAGEGTLGSAAGRSIGAEDL